MHTTECCWPDRPLVVQLPDAPWGIISIKAQDEDYETPMQVGSNPIGDWSPLRMSMMSDAAWKRHYQACTPAWHMRGRCLYHQRLSPATPVLKMRSAMPRCLCSPSR